jgi:TolB protein
MTLKASALAVALIAAATAAGAQTNIPATAGPGEAHLANIRQLTNVGTQAEAYFSRDGKRITFQSTRDGRSCDQQYVMNVDGTDMKRVSTGGGKTTCGWFLNDGKKLFFGSTHLADTACPPKPDPSKGYVWGIDPFDIFTVNSDGTGMKRLTNYNTYTAEGVLSPDGKTMVFTSLKDGDLDIFTMNIDGTNVKQLTHQVGYDGGPWWSPDGKKIAYRSYHPTDPKELADYKDLLARHLIRPSKMELWVMNADGSDQHQVTHLGGANFGPSWTRDGTQLIFSSNHKDPHSRNFDLYLVNLDGTGLEQITTDVGFDGFPMFSPDGKKLIWASQRADPKSGDVNLYIADWKH